MEKISRIVLAFTFAVFVAVAGETSERPIWVGKPPKSDSKVKYYVGMASFADDEAGAVRLATANAQERAILENFGATYKIDNNIEQSTKEVLAKLKVDESSDEVRLVNFELIESYSEKTSDDKINQWVLYSIPTSVISEEKKRLRVAELERKKEQARLKAEEERVKKEKELEEKDISQIAGYSSKGKIRAGMTQAEVHKYFGKPDKVDVNSAYNEATYHYDDKSFCEKGFFKTSSCFVHFAKGRVEYFNAFMVEYTDLEAAGGSLMGKLKSPKMKPEATLSEKKYTLPNSKADAVKILTPLCVEYLKTPAGSLLVKYEIHYDAKGPEPVNEILSPIYATSSFADISEVACKTAALSVFNSRNEIGSKYTKQYIANLLAIKSVGLMYEIVEKCPAYNIDPISNTLDFIKQRYASSSHSDWTEMWDLKTKKVVKVSIWNVNRAMQTLRFKKKNKGDELPGEVYLSLCGLN